MSPAQKRLRSLRDRQSKERQRMAELAMLDTLDDEQRQELDQIEAGTPDLERQLRAASVAVEEEDRASKIKLETTSTEPDAEQRERIELRGRCAVGRYLAAALRGRAPDGAEAELAAAAGVDGIPFELWQQPEQRQSETEDRAITPAPSTTGVNLDVLRPAVFAPSVASKLMLDMPVVQSGTYASGTIDTSATADAVAKGAAVPATAAGFAVQTTTPHRVGAGLDLAVEDVAAVGQANFEAVLRQHISLVLSSEVDSQLLNGDGQSDDLTGFFERLPDPTAAPAAATDFDAFAAAHAGGIDGLWASTIDDVMIVCGPATYSLASRTFQTATGHKGEVSAAAYAAENTGGLWTNSRMPAAATFLTVDNVQQAILCRKGRSMMPSPMRTAVCPVWFGSISIDDIFTGARSGQRMFTLSVLLGDVILVQPGAYSQIAFRVA